MGIRLGAAHIGHTADSLHEKSEVGSMAVDSPVGMTAPAADTGFDTGLADTVVDKAADNVVDTTDAGHSSLLRLQRTPPYLSNLT
ncbi:MAG: hypothetical protein NVS4B1_24560 [Ktedonobacteraceae bacterium]